MVHTLRALTLCLGLLPGVLALGTSQAKVLSQDASLNLRERPVMKIVRMLQDMEAELQAELKDDKEVHEMLDCWCKNNNQEKTQAIELGEAKVEQLQSTMDAATAKILELKAKRKATQEEMYADQKALGTATEMRMKENKEFHSEETDLLEAIDASSQAIVVLSKHHPELVQLKSALHALQQPKLTQVMLSATGLHRRQIDLLKSFMQGADSASSFVEIPGMKSYAPQSGQIFGILKQMKEDFEARLSEAQKTEKKAKEEYDALKAAKEDEISSAEKAIVQMDADIADLGEKHAQAAKEFEQTQDQLALDREFLENLKAKCAESDAEFDARVKSRLEEIAAVEDTIKILNTDESFDVMEKTLNTGFLQVSSVTSQQERIQRNQAATVLQRAAARTGAPQLALIAASVQLDAFTKVKAEIDKLVAELNQQQADEVKHRDWCIDELAANKRETAAADDKKTSLLTKIADLEKTIETLTADIKSSTEAIAEMQNQMKRASETREAENADFQQTISDQRLTQMILEKALARMKEVYALLQQPGAPHIQTSGTHTDPGNGPARFTKYEENAGGKRVVAMLESVFKDSQTMEAEALRAEEDSQSAYESFMKDSNKSIKSHQKNIASMTEARAKAKADLSMAKTDLKQTLTFLEGLYNTNGDLHKSCDYLLKNFEARQEARAAEVEALKEAKAILSGMQ